MRVSTKWLQELCPTGASVELIAERFTEAGLEIEETRRFGHLPGVVIAEVRGLRPHPSRDKLRLVTLFDGEREQEVVCGAPNVPEPGGRVLFARLGAELPSGMKIEPRKLGGVESCGMICSEVELDIGSEEGGIFVVDPAVTAPPGTLVEQALGLTDTVLEIGLTPNRPDCLGHVGLARELSALFGVPTVDPPAKAPGRLRAGAEPAEGMRPVALFEGETSQESAPVVPVRVEDRARCPRYATCTVEDVSVGRSPFWLRYRLHVLGLRAINNVVDATNLVLMEYGYPTHAFDLQRLRGGRIEVRVGRDGERATTLDGQVLEVGGDDLLICDGEGPVAIAGVMGGAGSGVESTTRHVLVECAYFEPRGVRRSSRRLGLHTDSSHRFERGVDPRAVPSVLGRVCGLLAELAGGTPCQQGFQVYPEPVVPRALGLRDARVTALLGCPIPQDRCRGILESLGCSVQQGPEGALRVQVPTWRPDLLREEDLIEEVARIYGYDRLPTETPRPRSSSDGTPAFVRHVRALKESAANAGLTEVVNVAFVSRAQLASARVSTDAVVLANPMSEERAVMRTSLLPGMVANARRAQRHQVDRVEIFELARVFAPTAEALPSEQYRLGVLLGGPRPRWIGPGESMDFYDGKGVLEALLRPLAQCAVETRTEEGLGDEAAFLHPRRAARVWIGGTPVGVLGELHPDLLDELDLSGPVVYADLDVAALFEAMQARGPVRVSLPPRYPASLRDLSVEVDEQVEVGAVVRALREAGGTLLESVSLFDLYRGDQVSKGKKSLAFRLIYRDPDGTLTDKRVDKAHAQLLSAAERQLGASLRA